MPYTYEAANTYARGDYNMGYYRGDPFLGKLIKGGLKAVAGSGIPLVSQAAGVVSRIVESPARTRELPPPPVLPPMIAPPASRSLVPMDVPKTLPGAVPQPGIRGTIERILPGGQSGYVSGATLGQGAPSGWHWNKSYSYAKGLPAGSFLVKNRHMNPVNPRALRRAIRRQGGMVVLMRRTLSGSGFTIKRSGLPRARAKSRRRR